MWEHQHNPASLKLRAYLGWDEKDNRDRSISMDNTIEGWVFRNNSMFSVRMLLRYDNLKPMDRKRNILTFPIIINKIVWGVLNIEDMPFAKYSRYSERIVQMIIKLAEPSLEQAIEYDTLIQSGEIDPETRLPIFSQFTAALGRAVQSGTEKESNLSIILLEITNYERLVTEYGAETVHSLYPDITDELELLTKNR